MSYELEAPESFEFTLGGHKYLMRYPTTEELEGSPENPGDIPEAEKERREAASKKMIEWFYAYIKPIDEASPSIEQALKKANVKVLQRFNEMVRTEFEQQ